MATVSISQAKNALVATLKALKTANGYSTNIPDTHFYRWSDQEAQGSSIESMYPKAFVRLLGADVEQLPSDQDEESIAFLFLVVLKRTSSGDDMDALAEQAIEDARNVLRNDYSLGNVVQEAKVIGYSMDGGVFDEDEAAALLIIDVKTYNQY